VGEQLADDGEGECTEEKRGGKSNGTCLSFDNLEVLGVGMAFYNKILSITM
jgi:hypothetical protein